MRGEEEGRKEEEGEATDREQRCGVEAAMGRGTRSRVTSR